MWHQHRRGLYRSLILLVLLLTACSGGNRVVNYGGGSFRVEEYKKPEFEVTVDAPTEPVMLGEKITAKIRAKYYFGSPVTNATVDVWTADALGAYSDTSTGLFLRGFQPTDADGVATFTTIYPGWYQGRAVHIHFKVRTNPAGWTDVQVITGPGEYLPQASAPAMFCRWFTSATSLTGPL